MSYDLYAEKIISCYEHPHNKGQIKDADAKFREHNMVCGDDITVYIKVKNNVINDAKFTGNGCAISIASASLITDYIKNKKLNEIEKLNLDKIKELLGIDPGAARMKCATLALIAIKQALKNYLTK